VPTESIRRRRLPTASGGPECDQSVSPFAGSEHPAAIVRVGELFGDGRYQAEELLGEGGMGIVVAARHVALGHRVAVKFLRPEARRREEAVARFRWEGRASLRIRSEHVVRVTDAGTLLNGVPYFVMELLEGMNLGELLTRRGQLPVEESLDYVLQACEVLAEAHRLGIVHRDLKPENLFLTTHADGTPLVKVIDFGLSSGVELVIPAGDAGTEPTRMEILGSPPYMSPEQVRHFEAVDARADIWSLGAMLYELLTGSVIHEADSDGATLTMICHRPVSSVRARRPDIPEELDRVILRCLERDRDRRIQNIPELAQALMPFAAARSKHLGRDR